MRGFKKAIKYAAAIATAGAMVGAGILAGMAYNLGDLPKPFVNDKGQFDAYVVVGENAATSDVVGAITVGAAFAQKAVTQVPVQGAGFVDVTGGAALYDMDHKLYLGDNINAVKGTLTADDLNFLASSNVQYNDDSGNTYTYDQYIKLGSEPIKFGDPDTSDNIDANWYVDMSSGNLYQAEVVFTNPANLTKITGEKINLFGNEYTIGEKSTYTSSTSYDIILYGSSNTVTINAGENSTVEVGGTKHVVSVIGINSDKSEAVISVDGVQKTVTAGNEYTINGVPVYVEDIYAYNIPSTNGAVKLSLGADKIELKNGNVYVGNSDTSLDGVSVSITDASGKIAKIVFSVTPSQMDKDYLYMNQSFTDPLFGFKLSFLGMDPSKDSSARETITLKNSADLATAVSFTAKGGYDVTLPVWYYDSTASLIKMADNDGNAILYKGASAAENEYIFTDAGGYIHLWKVDNVNYDSTTGKADLSLKDMITGKTIELNDVTTSGGSYVFYIDGQQITATFFDGTPDKVALTWNVPTTNFTVNMPYFETKDGAYILYGKTVTQSSALSGTSETVLLPGDCVATLNDNSVTYAVCNGINFTVADANSTAGYVQAQVYPTALGASNDGLVIASEKLDDGSYINEAWKVALDTSGNYLQWGAVTGTYVQLESNDNIYKAVDKWGMIMTKDTSNSDKPVFTVSYPDYQTYYVLGLGTNPQMTAAGTATSEKVNPISVNMAQLDTAMGTVDKPVILIGGPAVNKLVAQLAAANKTLSLNDWRNGNMTNKAIIQYVEDAFGDKPALIIAGYSAKDTVLASKVVAAELLNGQYADEFKGKDKVTIYSQSGEMSDINFE